MFSKQTFRKKYLLPTAYLCVLGMAMWSGNAMIPDKLPSTSSSSSMSEIALAQSSIEPAAGEPDNASLPQVSAAELKDIREVDALPLAIDTKESAPLRISPDKPEVIHLDEDAVNVLVGSEETLRAMPDTARSIILIPKKPGATFIKVMNAAGKVILQRHVIVGTVDTASKYLRIRRACAADDKACKQFSIYYCPDMCHEVSIIQGDAAQGTPTAPSEAPSPSSSNATTEYVEPTTPTPATK